MVSAFQKKNIYANTDHYYLCFWTGLGIWCALNTENLSAHEKLFLAPNAKEKSAGTRYQEQLMGIVRIHTEEVANHIRIEHMNAYGLRKGSATLAVSGTTSPPPVSSIARRGEWSMGKVLDVYWHFSEPGDHYLGRILAGMDPKKASFGGLPPHWTMSNPIENEDILCAMNMLFGPILRKHKGCDYDPTAMLLRCTACIVYHSDALLNQMISHPGHGFTKIVLLHEKDLLERLSHFVTTLPTDGVMDKPTGIPPHVEHAAQMKEILSQVISICEIQKEQTSTLVSTIEKAIDEKAYDSGNITGSRLREILASHQSESTNLVDDRLLAMDGRLKTIQESFYDLASGNEQHIVCSATDNSRALANLNSINLYQYSGRFFDVPQTFEFPKVSIRDGIRFWYLGQTISKDGLQVVKPFRTLQFLPKRLQNVYKIQWKGIFTFLENGIKLSSGDANTFTLEKATELYEQFALYLKANCSYCFKNTKRNPMNWSISTWSLKTRRSSILKYGSESDKANIGSEVNGRNRPRGKISRTRKIMDKPLYPKR